MFSLFARKCQHREDLCSSLPACRQINVNSLSAEWSARTACMKARGMCCRSVHMLGERSALICRDETYVRIDFKWVQTIFPVLIFVLFEGVWMFSPLCPLNVTMSHIILHFAAPGQTYTIFVFPWSTWYNYENPNFAQSLSHNAEDSLRGAVTGSSGQTSKPFTWGSEQPRDKVCFFLPWGSNNLTTGNSYCTFTVSELRTDLYLPSWVGFSVQQRKRSLLLWQLYLLHP